MCDSTVSRIIFFFNSCHHVLNFFFVIVWSLCSEKKTKAKAVGGTVHSGRATPASGEESSDHYELGPEGDEMDTAEDADAIQETDATDDQAPRYAALGSPADRYVFPFSIPPLLCVMTELSLQPFKPTLCPVYALNRRSSANQNYSYPAVIVTIDRFSLLGSLLYRAFTG